MSVARPDAPSESAGDGLAARLQTAVPELEDVRILRRLTGGSSHETWAFDARVHDLDHHIIKLVIFPEGCRFSPPHQRVDCISK